MDQKTVFISYRRSASKHLARSIYMDLKANDWDAFFDINSIDSGDFDRIILNQIGARAHFILLISPDSLARCANEGDWVLREIQEAVRLDRNIVPIVEQGADLVREMGYLPEDLRAIVGKKNALELPHSYFEEGMTKLRTRFLKTPEYITITALPAAERAEAQRRMVDVQPTKPPLMVLPSPTLPNLPLKDIISLLPKPFAWIDILGKGYSIAKYPITNAQFSRFIYADGYNKRQWWTDEGWTVLREHKWTQPGFWIEPKWNGAEQPVVGVSWYEAVAFCLWLSEQTNERIMLPTEDQWQYAAQGEDRRAYPWGENWDGSRCNNNVEGKGVRKATPVQEYEGKGESPFGVVDMAGNVWEWSLTDYENKTNDANSIANRRVLRGGSGSHNDPDSFRCDFRHGNNPSIKYNYYGFRISRS